MSKIKKFKITKYKKEIKPILQMKNISKKYEQKKVLQDLNMNILHSSITGLLGPNGSGKTTLFNILLGIVKADSGKIIASPDGKVQVCPLGNPGMATAGSGDVLAGTIGALTGIYQAQNLQSPENVNEAVMAAVYLHSASGDLAAQVTEHSVTASGIIGQLPKIFSHLENLVQ